MAPPVSDLTLSVSVFPCEQFEVIASVSIPAFAGMTN